MFSLWRSENKYRHTNIVGYHVLINFGLHWGVRYSENVPTFVHHYGAYFPSHRFSLTNTSLKRLQQVNSTGTRVKQTWKPTQCDANEHLNEGWGNLKSNQMQLTQRRLQIKSNQFIHLSNELIDFSESSNQIERWAERSNQLRPNQIWAWF